MAEFIPPSDWELIDTQEVDNEDEQEEILPPSNWELIDTQEVNEVSKDNANDFSISNFGKEFVDNILPDAVGYRPFGTKRSSNIVTNKALENLGVRNSNPHVSDDIQEKLAKLPNLENNAMDLEDQEATNQRIKEAKAVILQEAGLRFVVDDGEEKAMDEDGNLYDLSSGFVSDVVNGIKAEAGELVGETSGVALAMNFLKAVPHPIAKGLGYAGAAALGAWGGNAIDNELNSQDTGFVMSDEERQAQAVDAMLLAGGSSIAGDIAVPVAKSVWNGTKSTVNTIRHPIDAYDTRMESKAKGFENSSEALGEVSVEDHEANKGILEELSKEFGANEQGKFNELGQQVSNVEEANSVTKNFLNNSSEAKLLAKQDSNTLIDNFTKSIDLERSTAEDINNQFRDDIRYLDDAYSSHYGDVRNDIIDTVGEDKSIVAPSGLIKSLKNKLNSLRANKKGVSGDKQATQGITDLDKDFNNLMDVVNRALYKKVQDPKDPEVLITVPVESTTIGGLMDLQKTFNDYFYMYKDDLSSNQKSNLNDIKSSIYDEIKTHILSKGGNSDESKELIARWEDVNHDYSTWLGTKNGFKQVKSILEDKTTDISKLTDEILNSGANQRQFKNEKGVDSTKEDISLLGQMAVHLKKHDPQKLNAMYDGVVNSLINKSAKDGYYDFEEFTKSYDKLVGTNTKDISKVFGQTKVGVDVKNRLDRFALLAKEEAKVQKNILKTASMDANSKDLGMIEKPLVYSLAYGAKVFAFNLLSKTMFKSTAYDAYITKLMKIKRYDKKTLPKISRIIDEEANKKGIDQEIKDAFEAEKKKIDEAIATQRANDEAIAQAKLDERKAKEYKAKIDAIKKRIDTAKNKRALEKKVDILNNKLEKIKEKKTLEELKIKMRSDAIEAFKNKAKVANTTEALPAPTHGEGADGHISKVKQEVNNNDLEASRIKRDKQLDENYFGKMQTRQSITEDKVNSSDDTLLKEVEDLISFKKDTKMSNSPAGMFSDQGERRSRYAKGSGGYNQTQAEAMQIDTTTLRVAASGIKKVQNGKALKTEEVDAINEYFVKKDKYDKVQKDNADIEAGLLTDKQVEEDLANGNIAFSGAGELGIGSVSGGINAATNAQDSDGDGIISDEERQDAFFGGLIYGTGLAGLSRVSIKYLKPEFYKKAQESYAKQFSKSSESVGTFVEPKTLYRSEMNSVPSVKNSRGGNFGKGLYLADDVSRVKKHFNDGRILEIDVSGGNYFDVDNSKEALSMYNEYLSEQGITEQLTNKNTNFATYKIISNGNKAKEQFNEFLKRKGFDGIIGRTPAAGNQRVLFDDASILKVSDY